MMTEEKIMKLKRFGKRSLVGFLSFVLAAEQVPWGNVWPLITSHAAVDQNYVPALYGTFKLDKSQDVALDDTAITPVSYTHLKLYYVGADAKDSAVFEGRILVDAYKKDSSSLDRNGDGIVSYVLLEGESNHQDSLIRTEWSIQTLKDGGVPLEKITGGIASWERSQASAMMEQWLTEYPDQIELVVANNDDMALGAIDAIDRAGILPGMIKIVGIDATPPGMEALKAGKLFGTVAADKEGYANAIFQIAASLSRRLPVDESIKLENGKYFWCSQKGITQEDATETDNK